MSRAGRQRAGVCPPSEGPEGFCSGRVQLHAGGARELSNRCATRRLVPGDFQQRLAVLRWEQRREFSRSDGRGARLAWAAGEGADEAAAAGDGGAEAGEAIGHEGETEGRRDREIHCPSRRLSIAPSLCQEGGHSPPYFGRALRTGRPGRGLRMFLPRGGKRASAYSSICSGVSK